MLTQLATSCYAVFVYTQYVFVQVHVRLLFICKGVQNKKSCHILRLLFYWLTLLIHSIQLTCICLNNSLQLARFIGMLSAVLTPDLLMSTLILGINSLYSGLILGINSLYSGLILGINSLYSGLILGINSLYSGFSFLKQFILESKPLRQLMTFL